MEYNKFGNKGPQKKGRQLITSGPRDLQRRLAAMDDPNTAMVLALQEQILLLTKQLNEKRVENKVDSISPEKFDEELAKEIDKIVRDLKEKHDNKVTSLNNRINELDVVINNKIIELGKAEAKIDSLNEIIKAKDEMIGILKSKPNTIIKEVETEVKSDRPTIEKVFVDPLEKNAGSDMESVMNVKDLSYEEKENISDKLNKLKSIVGRLPSTGV